MEDILQYRAYQKLNSTYVEGLLKVIAEDGQIGRASCRERV